MASPTGAGPLMTEALAVVAAVEPGRLLNDRWSLQDYVRARLDYLSKLPEYAEVVTPAVISNAAHDDGREVYKAENELLSVQEVRRRELLAKIEPLTPHPTTGNTETLNNHADYPEDEQPSTTMGSPLQYLAPNVRERPADPALSLPPKIYQSPSPEPTPNTERDEQARLPETADDASPPAGSTSPLTTTNINTYPPSPVANNRNPSTKRKMGALLSNPTGDNGPSEEEANPANKKRKLQASPFPNTAHGMNLNPPLPKPSPSTQLIAELATAALTKSANSDSPPPEQPKDKNKRKRQTPGPAQPLPQPTGGISALANGPTHVPVKMTPEMQRAFNASDPDTDYPSNPKKRNTPDSGSDDAPGSADDDIMPPPPPPKRTKKSTASTSKNSNAPRPGLSEPIRPPGAPRQQSATAPKAKTAPPKKKTKASKGHASMSAPSGSNTGRKKTGGKRLPKPPAHLIPIITGAALPGNRDEAFEAARHRRVHLTHANPDDTDENFLLPEFFSATSFPEGEEDDTVRCLCGVYEDDRQPMIACDGCGVWQHVECMRAGVPLDMEGGRFECHVCDPWVHCDGLMGVRRGRDVGL